METKGESKTVTASEPQSKRELSSYNKFVRDNYNSVRHLKLHDRFRELSIQWKKQKEDKEEKEKPKSPPKAKTKKKPAKKKGKKKQAESK